MKKLKIFQVDAFTDKLFGGNPAAVCPLDEWLEDELMQKIAAENNLSETAFFVEKEGIFELRWFTPNIEIDLCGHATLASAFVIFNQLNYKGSEIIFRSKFSGELRVSLQQDLLTLNFPADIVDLADPVSEIENGLGIKPLALFKGNSKYMALLDSEEIIKSLKPDFSKMVKLDGGGLIVTAPGDEVDFVSRFFVPQYGINEDPVTGSAHTLLIPYWSGKLNKRKMTAKQLSQRGGTLFCENLGERVSIGDKAILYLKGEIFV